ncbi:MAG: hypothetical protein LBE81_01780 [Azonexus sp.]|jgi:hypothetical protein|uniref:hypothetical protein n=1 Tax=Azonexus sp. TaxID=1872668 RepID=UPI002827D0F5|nr:hypothetical protein [Azonexus sp.]MDR0775356.1 hypothetical protein [Azonexus sp.]
MKLFRGQPDHDYWRKPFTPTEKVNVWAGLGALSLLMGGMHWSNPPEPPFTGKWSWVYRPLYEAFGSQGIPAAELLVGALFIVAAAWTWLREKRKGGRNG